MTARQHDAHVRARAALLRRVVARWSDWSVEHVDKRGRRRSPLFHKLEVDDWTEMTRYAARALRAYRWHDGWGNKYGRYQPFSKQEVLGIHKGVPSAVVHSIMVVAMALAREDGERRAG